jgi:acetyltransferase-like isoleucine patch superfamily enzyme
MLKNFYSKKQLKKVGFKKVGENCKIDRLAIFYNIKGEIGDNVRIDAGSCIRGKLIIKSNVHIGSGVQISANEQVTIGKFSNLSSYVTIYTHSDNFSKISVPSGTLKKRDKKLSYLYKKKISIGSFVIIGTHSTLLPGAEIGDFATVGAYTTVNKKIKNGYFVVNKNILKNKIYKRKNFEDINKYLKLLKK